MVSAAELLQGRILQSGWLVKKKIQRSRNNDQSTGGNFSVGYEVEKDGKVAFLKAFDFSRAFAVNPNDPVDAMRRMTAEFSYEKNILIACKEFGIKKVVRLLDDGVENLTSQPTVEYTTQYLVFELAESNVRKETVNLEKIDPFWVLRCMHAITSGLYQLHQKRIIHQDIKPSNVLVFESDDIKIGDFGRSYSANHGDVEYNKSHFPGDRTYAPPEILYGYKKPPHELIRMGVDVYMLGSMLHFFFTKVPLTAKIIEKLPQQFHPNAIRTKDEILPYLQVSYDKVMAEFKQCIQKEIQEELTTVLEQLTNPDPEKRGHPGAHQSQGSNISLERYVSIFDRLSKKISIINKRVKK